MRGLVTAILAFAFFHSIAHAATDLSTFTRPSTPEELRLLNQVYAPWKNYLQSLKESGQSTNIPFTFDLIASNNGNLIFVGYRPDTLRDENTPVAILKDNDNDGWLDEFKDDRGWHKIPSRADWIIYNQMTPIAFEKLEVMGKSQMTMGFFSTAKEATVGASRWVLFSMRHLESVRVELEQELNLIDQAKQELETLEFGSEQYTFLRDLISQHEILLNNYLISTSAYQTAGLVGLDVMLLMPGILTTVAHPFSKWCIRLGKVITEAKSFQAAGRFVVGTTSKVKGSLPRWVVRASVATGGTAKEVLLKSSVFLKGVLARIGLTKKIVLSPGFDNFLAKYFPVNQLLLPELRPILIRNLSWAFSTTLWSEINSRGDNFFYEFDEVLQHIAVSLTFSAISSPYVLRPASGSKGFQKIFLSFAYAGTDAMFAQLRIEGFRIPSKEQTEYLVKKETTSVVWGMTAQNNYSLATDEVARHFQELRNSQPKNKAAIALAEGIFRLVSRVYNQSLMRLSQRQIVGYKASEKNKDDQPTQEVKPTTPVRPPIQMPTDLRPFLNH